MKKVFAMILALILCITAATAECSCGISAAMQLIAAKVAGTEMGMTEEQLEAVSAVALGRLDECRCETFREVLLVLLLDHGDLLCEYYTEMQVALIRDYLTHCGCCNQSAGKPVEEQKQQEGTQHTHRGGSHENGGICTGCGAKYQQHKVTIVNIDNSCHQAVCACGYQGEKQKHQAGELLGIESNGLGRYKCRSCGAVLYWYRLDWHDAGCGCCCECPSGECCGDCECACP